MRAALPILAVALLCASSGVAAEVDFARDVYPVLKRACFECHGPEKQKGGLRLDSREALLKGGDDGPAITPGDARHGELLRRIALAKDHDEVMPSRGELLTAAEIEKMRAWVAAGAPWPAGVESGKHWAYVAPRRPALPTGEAAHPIDRFIRARLRQEALQPATAADPHVLARRLSLDLIGLPPSPDRTAGFAAASQADLARTVEEYVDQLLASPQFGEKWARSWLDLARYGDSHGFQRDDLHDLWPYRDWVIRALNADTPYDQFSIEQLAGDLLPGATEAQKIATGFNRCAPCNVEAGTDPEENRVNQVFDRVATVGAVWLGATLECAQCHDHKYDPFTARDFYGIYAFFNQTALEAERANSKVPGSIKFNGPYMAVQDAELQARRAEVQAEIARLKEDLSARGVTPERKKRRTEICGDQDAGEPQEKAPADREVRRLQVRLAELERGLKIDGAPRTLVMQELAEPRATMLLKRGDFRSPGEAVEPATPAALHAFREEGPRNRLALARWLVSRENPLAARVFVNRIWAEIFGEGIVSTAEDFGIKGEPPSHPELLDWLAVEFMEKGWSLKQLVRAIVTSETYRQDSRLTPVLRERDPRNRLLAHGPRFRLPAEAIRDNALSIAGLLNLKQFGPPIRPPQPAGLWSKVGGENYTYTVSPGAEQHRRGIYVVLKRMSPYPSFIAFDATPRLACRVSRPRSNTPLQALTLLNDPVYVEAARAFAERIGRERADARIEGRLAHAFQLALARPPGSFERDILRELYQAEAQAGGEANAWFAVATALLNLDEVITKN